MEIKNVIVFGNNAAALLAAIAWEKRGAKVKLVDPGNHFSQEAPKFFGAELDFWPNTDLGQENRSFLEETLNLSLDGQGTDTPPLIFNSGEPSPFIGFGDKKYQSLPAIVGWNQRSQWVLLDGPFHRCYERMHEIFQGSIVTYSPISKIHLDRGGIESVEVGGNKDLKADHFVFAQSPRWFLDHFPDEGLSSRLRSKMARVNLFSRVSLRLDIGEDPLTKSRSLIFILPTQKDAQPLVGQFSPPEMVWHSYLSSEDSEDPERLANLIRQMKKAIEKALPQLAVALPGSRIEVLDEAQAEYPTIECWEDFKKRNNNMQLVSPLWSESQGLSALTEVCRLSFEAIDDKSCRVASGLLENPEALT